MIDNQREPAGRARLGAWAKFIVGALLLIGLVLALMQGYTPPGPAGDVFRNNQHSHIDATPLFYTDVESLFPDD